MRSWGRVEWQPTDEWEGGFGWAQDEFMQRASHALLELRIVDRVDQPDALLDSERMRGAAHELVLGPAEAALPLVNR